jgi:hypothetical protein
MTRCDGGEMPDQTKMARLGPGLIEIGDTPEKAG